MSVLQEKDMNIEDKENQGVSMVQKQLNKIDLNKKPLNNDNFDKNESKNDDTSNNDDSNNESKTVEKQALLPKSIDNDEPILNEQRNRFVLFPISNQEIWAMYKKHVASFWTAEEIDLHDDHKYWAKLTEKEKHFIKYVLAFFAASDGIVLENLTKNFIIDVKLPEARCFYAFQAAMENIHSETYSLLIDTYIKDEKEKHLLFNAMDNIECIKDKADWAIRWMNYEAPFVQRLVAFACVEGIFFSGSFCAIFWLKKRGMMPGLTFSNELISRDEGLHTDFACLLYRQCINKLTNDMIHNIIKEAVKCEKSFIIDSIPVNLIGMNSSLMSNYIEFVADRLCHALGHSKIYNTSNPFEWMELISLQGKTNFFERRVGEYAKANVAIDEQNNENKNENAFTLDADF